MVTLNLIILISFAISVSLGFYHSYTVRAEKPLFVQNQADKWASLADTTSTLILLLWIAGWIWHVATGTPMPPGGIASMATNVLVAISLIQRNTIGSFWRTSGYVLLVISSVVLLGMLSGCSTSAKYEDPVQPAGAVTITVPVPTCDDNLAKSLFMVTDRPKVLPINLLTEADKGNYDVVYKAYVETVQILTQYSVSLERDRLSAQMQCKAIRQQVDTLNTKTPVIPVAK